MLKVGGARTVEREEKNQSKLRANGWVRTKGQNDLKGSSYLNFPTDRYDRWQGPRGGEEVSRFRTPGSLGSGMVRSLDKEGSGKEPTYQNLLVFYMIRKGHLRFLHLEASGRVSSQISSQPGTHQNPQD